MKTQHTLVILGLLAIAACNADNPADESGDSTLESRVLPDENEIISKAYDNNYQQPIGFYRDERTDTPGSYSVYHVKDVSVSYELCTDDYAEAQAWEDADNDSRAVNGAYVSSYENERYFEFIRDLSYPDGIGNITDPTSPGFARVFKCSYVNRDGADRNIRDGYAGTLNQAPLTKESVRTYSEYMWQFTFFWPARNKVLQTFSSENEETYAHTLVLAFVTNRGTDNCDLIEVVDWVFSVDKRSGHLTKEFNLLFELEAELVDSSPRKCG